MSVYTYKEKMFRLILRSVRGDLTCHFKPCPNGSKCLTWEKKNLGIVGRTVRAKASKKSCSFLSLLSCLLSSDSYTTSPLPLLTPQTTTVHFQRKTVHYTLMS
ncbi:hypothetical protein DAI22_10g151500 [Oryza sativa Japonica Group]|nr:hypothetical protein DAI22_10g151500 [Oryza sativa Japonica Group]